MHSHTGTSPRWNSFTQIHVNRMRMPHMQASEMTKGALVSPTPLKVPSRMMAMP